MNINATRRPNPLLITPRETKRPRATRKTRSVPVAATTAVKGMTPRSVATVAPIKATADIGSGAAMMPAIVATNIANICQALGLKPSGTGMNQMMAPIAIGMTNFCSPANPIVGFDLVGTVTVAVMTSSRRGAASGYCCRFLLRHIENGIRRRLHDFSAFPQTLALVGGQQWITDEPRALRVDEAPQR